MSNYLFTSESVSEGHPDKVCDRIANDILDEALRQDPNSRVAIEALASGNLVVIAGEVTTQAKLNYESIARNAISEIGYNSPELIFDAHTIDFKVAVSQQSPEIANGVFNALEGRTEGNQSDSRSDIESLGAGDQGIIFGYANSDNEDYFPVAGKLSHLLSERLSFVRKHDSYGNKMLRPDAKTQVTIGYEDNLPVSIEKILISSQHSPEYKLPQLKEYLVEEVILPVISSYEEYSLGADLVNKAEYLINPAGEWNIGGPIADAGLVGRKIIVDSYNGYARHGGGNYNGKDASKVDRSAAYALRWVAKNLVAAGAATELEIQVAYAIGSSQPVSIFIDTKGKTNVGKEKISGMINEIFDLRPGAIIRDLDLKYPRYSLTSAYGHFGRNPNELFTWENLNKIEEIQSLL